LFSLSEYKDRSSWKGNRDNIGATDFQCVVYIMILYVDNAMIHCVVYVMIQCVDYMMNHYLDYAVIRCIFFAIIHYAFDVMIRYLD
jgi:hypothetical protein